MSPIKCFLCIETDKEFLYLRRYRAGGSDIKCDKGEHGYCQAIVPIGERQMYRNERGYRGLAPQDEAEFPHDHPLWPKACPCGYEFKETDNWQHTRHAVYRRSDTGEYKPWEDMPVGALRDCTWLSDVDRYRGFDGRTLQVKCPANADGSGSFDWIIDGTASNCDMPDDHVHRCWCRHGPTEAEWRRCSDTDEPFLEVLSIHVDKSGMKTCSAGAGSIFHDPQGTPPGFHGFLHNGHITTC